MASAQGMIGLAFTNTSPVVFPTRAKSPALGTNPIAFAAPTVSTQDGKAGEPVVLDMSTPTVPLGRIEVYHREGKEVPLGWGLNAAGEATTDPAAILFGGGLCPLGGSEETGGYKGYGLCMMVEMLCGVLAGAKVGPDIGQTMNPNARGRLEPCNLGECFIALDPGRIRDGYGQRLDSLVQKLHALPTASSAPGPVLVPGEKEAAASACGRRPVAEGGGILLSAGVLGALNKLGAELGVELPPSLRTAMDRLREHEHI
eukprot:gnl/TRDRNA2_/TRDRNA2_146941_c0_seq4.p1 gnl/TRDRNA2_/TRDRNA2_146941_c0~~gnl/TRDRNA2_/TRDRNA2_146941_c0_seq4.p1  ORF type:complete len:258 (+),score=42.56 gnl/TRDRNA2_/TRDRNA2_146941_c0_seq4:2-775(+)